MGKEKSLNLLDEANLRKYIQDVVYETIDRVLLNEISFNLGTYKDRIRNHATQIAINWCLVRYTYYNKEFIHLRKHWMAELKAQLNAITIAKVSAKNQSNAKYKSFLSVWAEFEFDRDEYSINGQIANKFETEGIDILSEDYIKVVDDFKNETKNIANVVASGDRVKVNEYVENICEK